MSTQTETHRFEAEVQEVLSLVIHSLYTNRDIFLRELVSNASDALDKLRFEALTRTELLEEGEELGIALEVDAEKRVLRIADNGIGMTRDELVGNLGTIASSGTKRFIEALKDSGKSDQPDLIGQFGVGFYSAFMVAEEVCVETRAAGSDEGWRWTSRGDGEYTLEPAEDLSRGTVISLSLREAKEDESDLLQEWTLREIIRRYSDFVEYPVQMQVERTNPKLDDEGEPIEGETETKSQLETLNSQRPLWARPKAEIEEEEYKQFYKHLCHDWNDPLETLHFRIEGTLEFTGLLYIPADRPMDLFDPAQSKSNISLYVRRVMIQKECEEIVPSWMRFVRGVVECDDLPLNVSRETLQANQTVRQIQKSVVRKVEDALRGILESDRERYEGFWEAFGGLIKEGIYMGANEKDRLAKLCLFHSTESDGLTTLAEAKERMGDGQESLWVLTAPDLATAKASPHLEAFASLGQEVLLLTEPVDEWMLQSLSSFDETPIKPVDKGEVNIEDDEQKGEREERQKEYADLLGALQVALDEDISEVRFSSRLKDSAAVLVAKEGGMSAQMERMLRRSGQDVPAQKRVLELNPTHQVVQGLKKLHDVDAASPRVSEFAELLLGQALMSEGAAPRDPARFGKLLASLMSEAVSG
ncbi:MAG: molecular chaperone HtpG [Planctomycetota bacterium]|jgi:molecular chaperone HtpG